MRAERERVAGELARARTTLPTTAEILPRLREKLREIEATLKADSALGRLALGELLGEQADPGLPRRPDRGDGDETARGPEGGLGAARLGGSGGGAIRTSAVAWPYRARALAVGGMNGVRPGPLALR